MSTPPGTNSSPTTAPPQVSAGPPRRRPLSSEPDGSPAPAPGAERDSGTNGRTTPVAPATPEIAARDGSPKAVPKDATATAADQNADQDGKLTVQQSPPRQLRGAAARVVANMQASLSVPTATSVRAVPAKLLADNRVVINNHLRRARGGKISFTHVIGFALSGRCRTTRR